jgi:hypothetical protein
MKTIDDFIKRFGDEPQEVTKNYAAKSLASNYNIKDAFTELCDNAYDARIEGETLNFDIVVDNNNQTITFKDNGSGISDAGNLFKLGGTDKEEDKNKVGKFGIGVPGAVSAIVMNCFGDKEQFVEVIYESACNGRVFEKHIAYMADGVQTLGCTEYNECDNSLHYTKITFNNVILKSYSDIIDSMEETFEEPLHKDLNISFNNRQLGKTSTRTFVGDEHIKTIKVGNFFVDVKYRIIGGESTKDRAFEETGLRVYDKETGRLLAKNTKLWKWYGNKEAQQTICGLRAAIYIEGSIESYKKFGILPAKNGIAYSYYFKDSDFTDLTAELLSIYSQASKTGPSISENVITINGRTFQTTTMKLDKPYIEVGPGSYLVKKKYSQIEIAELINENIALKKKYNKKQLKSSNNE